MKRKTIRYTALGILAVAVTVALLLLAPPEVNTGRLEFNGLVNYGSQPIALFTYHPAQPVQSILFTHYFTHYMCVDLTGREFPADDRPDRHSISGWIRPAVVASTNAVWRLKVDLVGPAKGMPAIIVRLENVWHWKRLAAWHRPSERVVGPVYSDLITNALAKTLPEDSGSSPLVFP